MEACGGTHLDNTREVEKIRILKAERIQDGVNRIIFAAGAMVDHHLEKEEQLYDTIVSVISHVYRIQERGNVSAQLKAGSRIFSVPVNQLEKTLQRFFNESGKIQKTTVRDFSEACQHLFDRWKQVQKAKKIVKSDEIEKLKEKGVVIPGTQVKVIAAETVSESTVTAGQITKDPNFVAHISDGVKISSAASENIDIDLRTIAPELGRILGGSGGGKPKLTQSGGPKKEKIKEALEKAKELTMKALS